MKDTSQKVTLPFKLDMENKGCSQFDINGMVKPYIEMPIYLCADFVGNSIVVGSEHLWQINLKNSHCEDNEVEIDPNYIKIIWLPSSHSLVDKI